MTDASAPRVAVVVPVYNGAAYLDAALRSIADQTLTDWVCVVVDDGSTDDTAAVAQAIVDADPRFSLVRQQNAGTPAARNAGLARVPSGTPYLSFVDGDDLLVVDALERLVGELDRQPDAVGVYGLAEYLSSDGAPYAPGVHPQRQRDRRRLGRFDFVAVPPAAPYTWSSWIVSGTLWPSAVALHRRSVVQRAGGFDTALRQVQDWDLYLRMSRFGPFVPVGDQVAWYRQHAANVTSRTDRVAVNSLLVRRRAADSTQNTPAQCRELRRVNRRLALRWAVRSAGSSARSLRQSDTMMAASTGAAVLTFAWSAVTGRVPEPTPRVTRALAGAVMSRNLVERP